jgi:short-subunit dehydrogenase
LSADVADADAVEAAAEMVEREFGPIQVWVNNAMTSVFSPVKELTAEEIRRVTEVAYLGVVHGSLSALGRMLPRNQGKIVQVGSALAYRAIPLQSAYCGAKHAIEGFTESLRSELLHDRSNVSVTIVHLPGLNTPQFDVVKSRLPNRAQPVPPIYQPEVAAEAILWAAHHDRRQLLVGASTAATILLNKFIPGMLDRYLARTNYEAQQTEQPEDVARPFNLWEPISGDRGAHGRFGERARPRSLQLWATTHRRLIAGVLAMSAAVGLAELKRN